MTLGRSGQRVSPLCLGAMTFGEDHGALSAPTLGFPADFLRVAGALMNGGTTVSGERSAALPMAPKEESERY